ncbi:MAG: hypothetical protein HYZ09_02985 [Candidatus Kerfeldbacteria bacterium]|nr:hypothetical protein [Candidatus Kerfeldbacteria bacterium]
MTKLVVVIRAGGLGTRLWPMSRRRKPKQFWPLVSEHPLIVDAYERYRPLVASPRRLFLTVAAPFVSRVRSLFPRLPRENIIGEPVSRNTGPAVGLESVVLQTRFGREDPVVASVTCDDVFPRAAAYRSVLNRAAAALRRGAGAVVAVGDRVSDPDPGLSYMQVGRPVHRVGSYSLRPVLRWVEKPTGALLTRVANAAHYVAHTGQYLWRLSTVIDILEAYHPHLWPRFARIRQAWPTRQRATVLAREYPRLPSLSIEQLVTAVAPRVLAACGDFQWSDTGKWFLIHKLRTGGVGNALRGRVVAIDSDRSLAFGSSRLIALLGVRDLIVVDTPDALLVTTHAASPRVKEMVDELARRGSRRLL